MKFLIVANGPFIAREIILELAINKIIVALDGAANNLAKLGIKPAVILGDFDSISEDNQQFWGIRQNFADMTEDYPSPYEGKYGCTIVPARDQNLTDLTKAIHYCDQRGAISIDIVCALGGRMDHSIGNLRTLLAQHKADRPIMLHTESQTIFYVKDSKAAIHGKFGDYCGIMAFPAGKFSSDEELKWNVTDYELIFGKTDSTCNQLGNRNKALLKDQPIPNVSTELDISGEVLIIAPGNLNSQRDFCTKTYLQQLKILCRQEEFVLFETTEASLRRFRETRRELKKIFDIENPNKIQRDESLSTVHYVSHEKESIFAASAVNSLSNNVLVSMLPHKKHAFDLFTRHKMLGSDSKNKERLFVLASTVYPERISSKKLKISKM